MMRQEQGSLWKACVGVLLLFLLFFGYFHYPDYDTANERQALLTEKEGALVEIVEEIRQDDYILCQLRMNGKMGCGVFREFLGKTTFEQLSTTSSDRMAEHLQIGGENYMLLICDRPGVRTAIVHYTDPNTMAHTAGEPVDMGGKQMILLPLDSSLGYHEFTEYFDEDGNLI